MDENPEFAAIEQARILLLTPLLKRWIFTELPAVSDFIWDDVYEG